MAPGLLSAILFATVVAGTPLILTALGELVTEKSGVLNLGAEGIMSVGAVAAFATTIHTGSPLLGVLAGMAAGMAMSALFGFAALTLQANQVASGLPLPIPLLSRLPLLGHALFEQQALVYFSWIMLGLVAWFLYRTRWGLALRAVGETPVAAHAIGYNVLRIRYLATLFGGAMAGIGGAFLSVFYTPLWVEGMVAGRGWISLALVVFATWRPLRVMLGAYLFGGAMITQMFVQGSGLRLDIPAQFLSALPYLATVLVLVLISRNRSTIRLNSPASLGQPFMPDT